MKFSIAKPTAADPGQSQFEPGAVVARNEAPSGIPETPAGEDRKRAAIAAAETRQQEIVHQMDALQVQRKDLQTDAKDLENRIGTANRNGDPVAAVNLKAQLAPVQDKLRQIDAELVKLQTDYREQQKAIDVQHALIADLARQQASNNLQALAQRWADVIRDHAELLDSIDEAYKLANRNSIPVGGLWPDREQPRIGAINVSI